MTRAESLAAFQSVTAAPQEFNKSRQRLTRPVTLHKREALPGSCKGFNDENHPRADRLPHMRHAWCNANHP